MKFFVQVMLLCLSTVLVAQTQISGTVTDKDGQPVPGANVVVDNLTGAATDFVCSHLFLWYNLFLKHLLF